MSPEITVKRILSLHYKSIRQALYLPYGVEFRIHLRSMLDRIGILNTKVVQSEQLKQSINLALIETSAVIDLARLQELIGKILESDNLVDQLYDLQEKLDEFFRNKEMEYSNTDIQNQILDSINILMNELIAREKNDVEERLIISLNNILNSLCHMSLLENEAKRVEV